MKKITFLLVLLCISFISTAQDYVVESIGFNPPHSYIQENANTGLDDAYSGIVPIGFDFEFFGNTYNEVVIGGNGVINFDTTLANGPCPWSFNDDLPSQTIVVKNAIFGAYHDMDPSVSVTNEVNFAQYGTAPNRRFVVNFYLVPHFQCNELESTFQIVMYETTNDIEVYIKDKPVCETWNNGNAVIGIQNIDGTEGIAAPGRNTSDSPWEAYNEGWRFSYFDGATVEAYNTTFSMCDTGNGGFELFDFNLIENDVAGNQSNVTITYHETFIDANDNLNPLVNPYMNISNPQAVYARVENVGGLYANSEIILEVIDCIDNDNDGVSTAQEDLNGDGYPGNDDTDNDGIPNYLDEDDDNDNVDTIDETTGIGAGFSGVSYIFIDTDSDGIENYIDNDDDGDGILSVFEDYNGNGTPIDDDLNNNSIPDFLDPDVIDGGGGVIAYQPDDLTVCDDDNDGFAVFDLTQTFDQIIGGQDPFDLLIYFFETQQDADLNTNAIANDIAYMNISNPQTIYVRVEHATTSEFDTTNFQLIVLPSPEIGIGPFAIFLCDDMINGSTGDDEISTFDLTGMNDAIALGDSSLNVRYYETLADQNNNNPINLDTAYQNITTPQTLFVSVFNTEGCESRNLLTLTVLSNPSPEPQDPFEVCDDDNDGFAEFMLTDLDNSIINGELGVTIGYYATYEQAVIGDPLDQLLSPYSNITPYTQIIWARAEYDPTAGGTGCYTIIEVVLLVNNMPDEPTDDFGDLTVFDDDGDGTAVFDLTINTPFVIGVQDPSNFLPVTYYVSQTDASNNVNVILTPSSYTSSGQTIWVRIENITTGCALISSFELIVDTTVGIGDVAFSDLTIHPNPASEVIQIQSTNFSSETNVVIYNIQGQEVYSEVKNSTTGNFTINVSDLRTGMYFIQVHSEGKIVAKKLIKQ